MSAANRRSNSRLPPIAMCFRRPASDSEGVTVIELSVGARHVTVNTAGDTAPLVLAEMTTCVAVNAVETQVTRPPRASPWPRSCPRTSK